MLAHLCDKLLPLRQPEDMGIEEQVMRRRREMAWRFVDGGERPVLQRRLPQQPVQAVPTDELIGWIDKQRCRETIEACQATPPEDLGCLPLGIIGLQRGATVAGIVWQISTTGCQGTQPGQAYEPRDRPQQGCCCRTQGEPWGQKYHGIEPQRCGPLLLQQFDDQAATQGIANIVQWQGMLLGIGGSNAVGPEHVREPVCGCNMLKFMGIRTPVPLQGDTQHADALLRQGLRQEGSFGWAAGSNHGRAGPQPAPSLWAGQSRC